MFKQRHSPETPKLQNLSHPQEPSPGSSRPSSSRLLKPLSLQRKYIDLIHEISGKWVNWDPPIEIRVGTYGTVDRETGELLVEGNIYDPEFQRELDKRGVEFNMASYPPEAGGIEEDFIIASRGAKRSDLNVDHEAEVPGVATASVKGQWTFERGRRGAVLILHNPRLFYLPPGVVLDLLYRVDKLVDKWLVTSIHTCPAYLMYLSDKSGEKLSLALAAQAPTTDIDWSHNAQNGLLRKACDQMGRHVFTPLYTRRRPTGMRRLFHRMNLFKSSRDDLLFNDSAPWGPLDEDGGEDPFDREGSPDTTFVPPLYDEYAHQSGSSFTTKTPTVSSLMRSSANERTIPPSKSEKHSPSSSHRHFRTHLPTLSVDFNDVVSAGGINQKIDTLLQWFNGLDCTTKHQELAVLHVDGTCSWLYRTDQYLSWRNGNVPFLWLQGKAGSGKSVLAYSVIEDLKKTKDPVIFFYCDFQDHKFASAVEVMYSLLSQILRWFRDNSVGIRIGSLIEELLERKANNISTDDQLPSLVARAAQEFVRPPLVIIDALDECKDIEKLLDALMEWNKWGEMQLFVTSRPLQILQEKLLDVDSISVISWNKFEEEVSTDILIFAERELDTFRLFGAADTDLKEMVKSDLLKKAEGMFLWVKYQVDMVTRCSNVSEVREMLDELPVPVDFYDRIINKQTAEPKIVRRILTWLVSALRPLRLCEVVELLMIDVDWRMMKPNRLREVIEATMSTSILHRRTLEGEIGNTLLHLLGSLVTYDEVTGRIAFLHSSIKTYLTDLATNRQYRIDLQDAHEEFAATCMCYLSLCLSGSLTSVNNEPPFRITSTMNARQLGLHDYAGSPFLDYVLTKSFHHLSFLLPGNEVILGDMLALESDIQQHLDEWEHLRRLAAHIRPWPSTNHDFIVYTLVAFAPDWLLGAFLDREPLFRRLERHHGTNPLVYTAFFHTNIDHAQTLLCRGANLHSTGWLVDDTRHILPLVAAVQAKDKSNEMVDLFLEWGSPVPPDLFADLTCNPSSFTLPIIRRLLQTNEFVEWSEHHQDQQFPLHSCISIKPFLIDEQDLIATLWRLVQVGFDPCVPDSSSKTIFHLALAKGFLSVVEYLVSIGVRVPNNILFFMLERGHWNIRTASMICYLLTQGADVHVRHPPGVGDTALHTAIKNSTPRLQSPSNTDIERNLEEIVVALVESGCDANARNTEDYTPLHLAIIGGHVSVVKYLSQVTTPFLESLSEMVSLAPSSVREDIKKILMNNGWVQSGDSI